MALKEMKGPNCPTMPDAPSGDWWNETQWRVVTSLVEAVIPSIASEQDIEDRKKQKKLPTQEYDQAFTRIQDAVSKPPDQDLFKRFLLERPVDDPAFNVCLKRILNGIPLAERKQLGGVLSTMSTRVGAYLVTGYCTPVDRQPVHVREAILQAWATSWIPSLRLLSKSITQLSQAAWARTSPLFKQVTGYADVPPDWKPKLQTEATFMQFKADAKPAVVDTDVVIIGSGCGGAVCAKILAEAGHRVVVVEKSYYFPPSQLPMPQMEGSHYLFENAGFVPSVDSSTSIVAGSTWGGGGAVNWCVSLEPQDYVRKEWAQERGLSFFETQDFQDCLDRVKTVMGVSVENNPQSHAGQMLLDGAEKLGYKAAPAPQNNGGEAHQCGGYCHFGCRSAGKRGPTVTWLPAAAEAGAKFIEGLQAELVFENDKKEKAIGVRGKWVSRDSDGGVSGPLDKRVTREVVINAKKVIVSGGSLWSPVILKKSGLTNRQIGRNLYIHPVNFVLGHYDDDIDPMQGGIITSYCKELENLDGKGHGTKLETTNMAPCMVLPVIPWRSALDFKLTALRWRHLDGWISLCRDRDTGRVFPDPVTGAPRVDYTPSAFDRAHILEGVIALAKIGYLTGAREIRPCTLGVDPFVAPEGADKQRSITDPAFAAWLEGVRKAGNTAPGTRFASAHQMGTCRMSVREEDGVVDSKGRVWGVRDLYVADASVFPSASGVNPMVTNMAISDWIARGIAKELGEGVS